MTNAHVVAGAGDVRVALPPSPMRPEGRRSILRQPGDVIHAVNGDEVAKLEDLREILARLVPGSPVAVRIERGSTMRYLAPKRR